MKLAKRKAEQARPATKPQTIPNTAGVLISHQEVTSGPLPDPVTFQSYDKILPGAAERILAMAEANAKHAREMEKDLLAAHVQVEREITATQRIGQWFGLIAVAMEFGLAGYASSLGYPVAAAGLASATVVGLSAVFVCGRIVDDRGRRQQNRGNQDGHPH